MIDYQLTDVIPFLVEGQMLSLSFKLTATELDITEDTHWHTPCTFEPRELPFEDADYETKAGEIAEAQGLYAMLEAKVNARKAAGIPDEPTPPAELSDPERKLLWFNRVDDVIGNILTKSTRFQMGYIEREAAAISYRDSGYAGDPDTWISRFADNVGMPYRMATDLILNQALFLRKANKDLEDLRMDKYLIMRAATIELAETEFMRIVTESGVIGATL